MGMKYKDPTTGNFKEINVKVADTLPVGSEVDYNGTTIPTGWEEVDSPNDYSTEETRIGTWFGKPLYRKVIIINNTVFNKGENTIAHGISNMDKGIKITCFNYNGIILPYINLNADSSLRTAIFITGIDSTNIFFRVVNDSWGAQNNWCVIIEYTKTTD